MNSTLNARIKSENRERFASPVVISGLAGIGLLMLLVLYPEKSLLRLLSAPEVNTPAQQRYLEALIHLRGVDPELLIILVRSYLAAGSTDRAARVLALPYDAKNADQAGVFASLVYELRRQQLARLSPEDPSWHQARQRYADQIETWIKAGATSRDLSSCLYDAKHLGDKQTVGRLENLLGLDIKQIPKNLTTTEKAKLALGQGNYLGAATFYFRAMKTAKDLDTRRTLFIKGLKTLQAGNLLDQAMISARRHRGDLVNDRATLLFLIRLSLAAGRPDLAQIYSRMALSLPSSRSVKGRDL